MVDLPVERIFFDVILPEPPQQPNDIDHALLVIVNGDQVVREIVVAIDAKTILDLSGPKDAEITLNFHYVDSAGNRSEPSVATFSLKDITLPHPPGKIHVKFKKEKVEWPWENAGGS